MKLREYYGQDYWAQPTMKQTYITYNTVLYVDSHWGVVFAVGITAIILYSSLVKRQGNGLPGGERKEASSVPIEERVLALMLLWLPVIAVTAAKVSHGGLTERHMLPTVLGCALALGYAIEKVPSAGRLLLLILFLMNYEAFSVPVLREAVKGSLLAQRESAKNEVATLVGRLHESNLPIVIGSELDYLPIAYYTPADLGKRLYVIVDPNAAVTYLNTASGDLGLLVIQQYYPLQVEDFGGFVSAHQEFLLVSGGDFDWLTPRLVHDGDNLKLVSAGEGVGRSVYEVSVVAKSGSE